MKRSRRILLAMAALLGAACATAVLVARHELARGRADEARMAAAGHALLASFIDRAKQDAERLAHPDTAVPPAASDTDPAWAQRDHEVLARCQDLFEDAQQASSVYEAFGEEAWSDAAQRSAIGLVLEKLRNAPAQCFARAGTHVDGSAAARAAHEAIAEAGAALAGTGQ